MCKYLAGALFVLLVFITLGNADQKIHWWGTIIFNGSGIGGANVWTGDASTYSSSTTPVGRYHLTLDNGMVEDQYYEYIYASKVIGGTLKSGSYYVDDYYHDDVEKGNLDIVITDPNK